MEHDVAACVVGHAAFHGQILKIGVMGGIFDDQHIALADSLKRARGTEAVVPRGRRSGVDKHCPFTALADNGDIRGFQP